MRPFVKYLITIVILMTIGHTIAGPAYPLKLSPGNHYIADANGNPFLIQGCSPWFLTENLSGTNVAYYLSVRQAQGYNSIVLDIAAQPLDDELNDDTNQYGQHPFIGTTNGYTNLLMWNSNYFTNVDAVLQAAAADGFCCFIYPLYDGYAGAGWYAQMTGNSTNSLFQYGQFIGNRYKNYTNIVWIGAGDYTEPGTPTTNLWNWVAAGIESVDTNHLITAQAARPTPASVYSKFITVEATYPSTYTYIYALNDYQAAPVLAAFSREPYYEYNTLSFGTPLAAVNCRNFAWWSVLSGDAGQFYGNESEWPFTNGWQTQIVDHAATSMTNVAFLLNQYSWWNLVPDSNHVVFASGYGTYGTTNYAVDSATPDGKLAIAYLPLSGTVTMNMAALNGSIRARWFDPTSGSFTTIAGSPFTNAGLQSFTSTAKNSYGDPDWVLVLDANPLSTNSLSITTLGNGNLQLTVLGDPNQVYSVQFTTDFSSPWQTIGTGTTDISGTFLLDVPATSSAGFYRTTSE